MAKLLSQLLFVVTVLGSFQQAPVTSFSAYSEAWQWKEAENKHTLNTLPDRCDFSNTCGVECRQQQGTAVEITKLYNVPEGVTILHFQTWPTEAFLITWQNPENDPANDSHVCYEFEDQNPQKWWGYHLTILFKTSTSSQWELAENPSVKRSLDQAQNYFIVENNLNVDGGQILISEIIGLHVTVSMKHKENVWALHTSAPLKYKWIREQVYAVDPPKNSDDRTNVDVNYHTLFNPSSYTAPKKFNIEWNSRNDFFDVMQLFPCKKNHHEFIYDSSVETFDYNDANKKLLFVSELDEHFELMTRNMLNLGSLSFEKFAGLISDHSTPQCPGLLNSWRRLFGTWSSGRSELTDLSNLRCDKKTDTRTCETFQQYLTGDSGFVGHASKTTADLTVKTTMDQKFYLGSFFSMKAGVFPELYDDTSPESLVDLKGPNGEDRDTYYSNPTRHLVILPTLKEVSHVTMVELKRTSQESTEVLGMYRYQNKLTTTILARVKFRFLVKIQWFDEIGDLMNTHYSVSTSKDQVEMERTSSSLPQYHFGFRFDLRTGGDPFGGNNDYRTAVNMPNYVNAVFSDITGRTVVPTPSEFSSVPGSNFICGKVTTKVKYSDGMTVSLYSDPMELIVPCVTQR